MRKVFVYGTLLSGDCRSPVMKDQTFIGPAKTEPEFTMLHLGGFPGLVFGGGTVIEGELYGVDEKTEQRLDMIEGVNRERPEQGLYRREFITVMSDNVEHDDVLVYIFNNQGDADHDIIESGSWRQANEEKPKYRYG